MNLNLDWNAISAIAEVVGLIGVLLSIIFLISEVRHNARAIEGATVQSLMSLEREVFSLLADNAELYTKAASGDAQLSDSEKFCFNCIVSAEMSLLYSAYVQHEQGLIDDDVWIAYENAAKRYLALSGFRESWKQNRSGYPTAFQERIERVTPNND